VVTKVPVPSVEGALEGRAGDRHLPRSLFDLNGFARWTIELGLRKSGFEPERIFWARENDDIDIVCHAGFSVVDGSNTAGDHVCEVQSV